MTGSRKRKPPLRSIETHYIECQGIALSRSRIK